MNLEIREMTRDEASAAWKAGRPCFGPVEGLAFKKPKHAFLAVSDGEIVGMASYRFFPAKNNQKIGYVETGFVKKGWEGKGIGSRLYKQATSYLKEQGCETVTATVKDDNVASWKLFENNGYHVTGFGQMIENYGVGAAILLWLKSTLAVASGFHLWSTIPAGHISTAGELWIYAVLNLLVMLPALVPNRTLADFGMDVGATALLLAASLLGGFLVTLFSKEKWGFQVTRGGFLISLVVSLFGGIWPVVGRFYPYVYKRTPSFGREMGLESLFEWLAILLSVGAAAPLKGHWVFWESVFSLGTSFLVIHSLPFYPFECFGGGRLWSFSKGLCLLTVIISVALVFL